MGSPLHRDVPHGEPSHLIMNKSGFKLIELLNISDRKKLEWLKKEGQNAQNKKLSGGQQCKEKNH